MNADPRTNTIEISDPAALPARPLVSVCMITFNHERFISSAIEGVFAQRTDFPFELIIGEDCSTDGTRDIVRSFQKRRPDLIRLLTSEVNVGMNANGSRCERACRGEYIATCEGDDYWIHPYKLQLQVDLMRANPEMAFCHTDFDRLTRVRRRKCVHRSRRSRWLARGDAYIALLHEWSVMTATCIFRRDVLEEFRSSEFNNPQWPFGDRNRLLFCSLKGTVGYIDASTATYRKVGSSAWNKSYAAQLRMEVASQDCVELFLARYGVGPDDEPRIRARLKRAIYRAAFLTERADLMRSCHRWMVDNGFARSSILHRIRLLAVELRIPVRIWRAGRNFFDVSLSAFS